MAETARPARALYLVPVGLALGLLLTYLVAPRVYRDFVLLDGPAIEFQWVELMTFACALVASVLLFACVRPLWRSGYRPAALVVALAALAAFFFAGEEISWGQTYFGWPLPDAMEGFSPQTNLHNSSKLPVRQLANAYVFGMYVGLPVVWWILRRRGNAPRGLGPAVPEAVVAFAVVFATAWRGLRSLYRAFLPEDRFYRDFVFQMHEHKELLVAVAILMYAVMRVRVVGGLDR